jgi:hypothetical protein
MRARATQLANVVFWVVVVAGTLRYVFPKWREFGLSSRLLSLDLGWIAGSLLVFTLQLLVLFLLWRTVLRLLGAAPRTRSLFRAFGFSLLPKYVPGKVLGSGLRVGLTAKAGVSYPVAIGSLVWEVGFALSSSGLITMFGLALGVTRELEPTSRWMFWVFPLALLAGLILLRIPRLRSTAETWAHLGAIARNPVGVVALFVGYLCTWLLYTTAHWMVAQAIAPVPLDQAIPLLVALATSWTIGFLSFFAPAGLGVREGTLFIFARGLMGSPAALLFVTLSRLVILVAEVLITLVAALIRDSGAQCPSNTADTRRR